MTDWLTDWLTDLQRHLDSQGTRKIEAIKELKALGHSKCTWTLGHSMHFGPWAFEVLGHSKGTWALRHSRYLDTWPLRHLVTWALEWHLGTRGTRGILFCRLHINTCINIFFLSYCKLKQHQKSNSTYIKEHTCVLLGLGYKGK